MRLMRHRRTVLVSVRAWLDFATERVPQMQEAKIKSREIGLEKMSAASEKKSSEASEKKTSAGNEREEQKQTVEAVVTGLQRSRVFYVVNWNRKS